MRLRIVRTPTESRIDGIRLDRFHVGTQYEVGTALGGVFLAEGWAVPVPDDAPEPEARAVEYHPPDNPPNLIRESDPPWFGEPSNNRPEDVPAQQEARRSRQRGSHEHTTPPPDSH